MLFYSDILVITKDCDLYCRDKCWKAIHTVFSKMRSYLCNDNMNIKLHPCHILYFVCLSVWNGGINTNKYTMKFYNTWKPLRYKGLMRMMGSFELIWSPIPRSFFRECELLNTTKNRKSLILVLQEDVLQD